MELEVDQTQTFTLIKVEYGSMKLYSVRDTKNSQLNARALIKVPTDSE